MSPIRLLRRKNLHTWALPWALHAGRALLYQTAGGVRQRRPLRHLLFCFCDHYEPEWGAPGPSLGEARVAGWQHGYPRAFSAFRDADGRPPQHTFFFPGEEYRPAYLLRLSELVYAGYGEVELHLHHDHDTAAALREKIASYLHHLGKYGHFSRHLALSGDRDREDRVHYGFIHGNWALANANRDGRACGVDEELEVLFETGCYADFTFPSAPHPTQPRLVNQLYWPTGDLKLPRSYEQGEPARVGCRFHDRILIVEGPLALALRDGTLMPRIEAAAVTANDPPTPGRIRTWVRQGISVRGRPEWVFVKIHTHGAPEAQAAALLGPPGQLMHRILTSEYNDGARWALHYVTARELYNIACAAMDGHEGDPAAFRNYCLAPPPARQPVRKEQVPVPADPIMIETD